MCTLPKYRPEISKLVILIHHFAKSHRVPDNFSQVQVDGFDRPFSSRILLKVEIDGDFSHSQSFARKLTKVLTFTLPIGVERQKKIFRQITGISQYKQYL